MALPLVPLLAAGAAAAFLLLRGTTVHGKSGRTWHLKTVNKAPTLLGMDQIIEVSGPNGPVLQYLQVGSSQAYKPVQSAPTVSTPEAVDCINDLGLVVVPPAAQNSSTSVVNGTTYKLDQLGSLPDGRVYMQVSLANNSGFVPLMRVAQVVTDAATRRIIDTPFATLTPELAKALTDFQVPPVFSA